MFVAAGPLCYVISHVITKLNVYQMDINKLFKTLSQSFLIYDGLVEDNKLVRVHIRGNSYLRTSLVEGQCWQYHSLFVEVF